METEQPLSQFACQACKRQKVKCDRTLPSCSRCNRVQVPCIYPSSAAKPGPKIGASHMAKKQRLDDQAKPSLGPESRRSNSISIGALQNWNHDENVSRELPACTSMPQYSRPLQSETNTIGDFAAPSEHHRHPSYTPTTASSFLPTESSVMEARTLSNAIHPSHEPITRSNSRNGHHEPTESFMGTSARLRNKMIFSACELFEISIETYQYLLSSYFENMTAFSLFNKPLFDAKLLAIRSEKQRHALLAAIFHGATCFSRPERDGPYIQIPASHVFFDLASRLIDDCLDECSDRAPPLCMLQALILITFGQLIKGVRGRAWRLLGTCVRIAYELQLHCVDANESSESAQMEGDGNSATWQAKEEKRRAWWAIWEFDVFASTIRRLPTAIDWGQNFTCLPIDDELWYSNAFQGSCFLPRDSTKRVELLKQSGNEGGKAWFIVINSLTRIAQSFPYHHSTPGRGATLTDNQPVQTPPAVPPNVYSDNTSLLASTLHTFSLALPSSLCYTGEYLTFKGSRDTRVGYKPPVKDHDKYSIHMMKQLAKFLLHHQIFLAALRQKDITSNSHHTSFAEHIEAFERGSWDRYMGAVNDVTTLIRSSAENHVQHMNPFLANTVWFAAAALVTYRLYGPQSISHQEADDSTLRILRRNLAQYVKIWKISSPLLEKLDTLESRLVNLARSSMSNGERRDIRASFDGPGSTMVLNGVGSNGPASATHGSVSVSHELIPHNFRDIAAPLPVEWESFDFAGLDNLLNYENFV